MPLLDHEKHLLYELFGIPYEPIAVETGEYGMPITQAILDPIQAPATRLKAAISSIDADETKVVRVREILAAYSDLSLDPSPIERNGYSLRPGKNIRLYRRLLFTYTGLISDINTHGNRLPLG
ncbi:hypothetical protein [Stenomitos frigidus]|uniref:Uncharacterized protein n=1 Tax=Stenomitos frigidus ULC18 TaxID=2107698 RepID=A0A2T1E0R3_9CYAN|nr:hypothetical protein [Stenomitos frigidus]PSB26214.1 hypothetical protein C7B82_20565 [Stenomitos frigidus ULC18]